MKMICDGKAGLFAYLPRTRSVLHAHVELPGNPMRTMCTHQQNLACQYPEICLDIGQCHNWLVANFWQEQDLWPGVLK